MIVDNVSNEYKELMKQEINNKEHKYSIRNITRNLDLTDLLINESLVINRFLRTSTGNISPNTLQLNLIAITYEQNDILLKDFQHAYSEFQGWTWKQLLNLENLEEYLCKIGDLIQIIDSFNDEELIIFTGNATNVSRIDSFNGREVKIVVDDNTIKGYTYNFSEDIQYQNMFLYKNNEKEKSLLYILCRDYLEIQEDKILIEDMKLLNGEYIKIPLAKFQKNTSIMSEIAELIRSVYGNIYSLPDGSIKINSWFNKGYINKLDITIGNKKGNFPVLEFVESTDIKPANNKVEVKYTNTLIEDERVVFSLGGYNATIDDANILIPKNTLNSEKWWQIDFDNIIDLKEEPIVKAYIINDNSREYFTYTEYELEKLSSNRYKVKFNNSSNKDVYLEKFEFLAKPIIEYNDNEVSYSENTDLTAKNTSLKTVSYKYIQSKEQAKAIANHTFYNECRSYTTVKLRTNNCPFLKLEDVINLDFKKYKDKYQIISITQTNEYTELLLKLYREYESASNFTYSEKSNNLINNKDYGVIKNIAENNKKEINTIDEKVSSLESSKTLLESKLDMLKNEINEKEENLKQSIVNLTTKSENDLSKNNEDLKELIKQAKYYFRDWQELDINDFNSLRFPDNCKELLFEIEITNPKYDVHYSDGVNSVILTKICTLDKIKNLKLNQGLEIGNYVKGSGASDVWLILKNNNNEISLKHMGYKYYTYNFKIYWR